MEESEKLICELDNIDGRTLTFIPDKEFLISILSRTNGNVQAASKALKFPDGTPVPKGIIYQWIKRLDIDLYPIAIRAEVAKDCLDVLIKKAVVEEDIKAIENILNRWGKYIGFEDPKKEMKIEHIASPWEEILNVVDPQRTERDKERKTDVIEVGDYLE